jgi:hypothetical protein
MKRWTILLAGIIALAMLAHVVTAQPEGGEKQRPDRGARLRRPGERPGGAGRRGEGAEGRRRQSLSPLMRVLDANKDGKLSAEEINNAKAALLTLDKNDDGELTREELRPRRPGGEGEKAAGEGREGKGGRGGRRAKGGRERSGKRPGGGAAE